MARIVSLSGGGPWGMAISGGKDFGSRVKVTKVTPKGKAMLGGVQLGYYILEVNGTDLDGLTHHEVQSLIRTAGSTLTLKITNEQPKGGAAAPRTSSPTPQAATTDGGRPRPPPPPAATSPTGSTSPKTPGSTPSPRPPGSTPSVRPTGSTAVPRPQAPATTPARPHPNPPATVPEKNAATYYHEPVRAEDSKIVPDSGLSTYVQSTQQSPAFKKIHPESPSAFSPGVQVQRHTDDVDSASHQMRNVVIEEGGVKKTSQRPGPPPASPSTFTTTTMKVASNTGPKQPAVAKPAPPPSVQRPQPPPSFGICEACHQPITGTYASAMGKYWHVHHLLCSRCDRSLGGDGSFRMDKGEIICRDCFEQNLAKMCAKCNQAILSGVVSTNVDGEKSYHVDCFKCCKCSTDLTKLDGFNPNKDDLYCEPCYTQCFGPTCDACGKKCRSGQQWLEAMGKIFHPACFVCTGCKQKLQGKKAFSKEGNPFCQRCC